MSLHDVQTILARLATDHVYRQTFFADREAALSALILSDSDRLVLSRLAQCQVERFAHSLHAKRRIEVLPLIPWTAAALGHCLPERFARHCEGFQPAGLLKPGDDARAFCAETAQDASRPTLLRELARWESARIAAALAPVPRFRLYWFRCVPRFQSGRYFVLPGVTLAWSSRTGLRGLSLPWGKPASRP